MKWVIHGIMLTLLLTGAFGSGYWLAYSPVSESEKPLLPRENVLPQKAEITALGPFEVASPKDRIPESNILVYPDQVILNVKNTQWSRFTDTNSMDPVIDAGANALQIVPQTPEEIQIGDIISYETEYGTIIHRVKQISYDEQGWYAVAKGDNNPTEDPFRIRFSQIKRVVVGIIY